MKDDLTILVVTHKEYDDSILDGNSIYKTIKVGTSIQQDKAKSRGWLSDDTGDNMADENPYYCELTALYWNWKNMDADITGLVHYRRFFVDCKWNSRSIKDDILGEERIRRILQTHRMILPPKIVKPEGSAMLYKHKPKEGQDRHWLILEEIIQQDYPDYMESFRRTIYRSYTTYCLNMFITTRALMDEYCQWLFDVLKKYDDRIAQTGEERLPRVDGFLSETLLQIWVGKRLASRELYHVPIKQIKDDMAPYYGKSVAAALSRLMNSSRIAVLSLRKIKSSLLIVRRLLLSK